MNVLILVSMDYKYKVNDWNCKFNKTNVKQLENCPDVSKAYLILINNSPV